MYNLHYIQTPAKREDKNTQPAYVQLNTLYLPLFKRDGEVVRIFYRYVFEDIKDFPGDDAFAAGLAGQGGDLVNPEVDELQYLPCSHGFYSCLCSASH